jgi:hypothetical protein
MKTHAYATAPQGGEFWLAKKAVWFPPSVMKTQICTDPVKTGDGILDGIINPSGK